MPQLHPAPLPGSVGRSMREAGVTKSPDATKVLTSAVPQRAINLPAALAMAAQTKGVSQFALAGEIIRRRVGRQKLTYNEYFQFGLYRPDLADTDRDAFASDTESMNVNNALRPQGPLALGGFFADKSLMDLVLRGAGLPRAETLAVSRATPAQLPYPVLMGADQIAAFLASKDRLPVFGKPVDGSRSIGAASFVALDGDRLVLGDGTQASLRALAEEIARDYPKGYIFQSLLRPHPEMERLTGPVVGTLRVVTLRTKAGPAPLYSVLKLPGPGAMVDGRASGKNGMALVDLATGTLVRAQLASAPAGTDQNDSLVTGAFLPGARLPDWDRAISLATDVHALFADAGLIGADIILSDKGPVITELNGNPLGSLYQRASGRGLFNPEFAARYREALLYHGAKLPLKGARF
jgi:Sugar-transfer associated ATP-grasp